MKLFIVAAAAAVTAMAACSAPTTSPPPARYPLQRQLEAAASGTGALAHLRQLQRIADQNGGNRASPGPGYDASVDYVARVLRKAGWKVSTPEFDVEGDRMRNVIAQTKTGDTKSCHGRRSPGQRRGRSGNERQRLWIRGALGTRGADGRIPQGDQPGATGVVGR
jgi:hypothetical protein